MSTYGSVLDALGDPTRRAIVELLRPGPRPVGELAANLPVSRPAVSQHLKVLKAAGLVSDTQVGTRRLYGLDPAGVAIVRAYFDQFWDDVLADFASRAQGASKRRKGGPAWTRPPRSNPSRKRSR